MGDELADWAGSSCTENEDEDWRDFHAAVFRPLAERHPDLAVRLAEGFVREFLRKAELSQRRYGEALHMLVLEEGTTPLGRAVLRVTFPFMGSTTTVDWDGTADDAEASINSLAETLATDAEGDRDMSGPTGWEPEFDG